MRFHATISDEPAASDAAAEAIADCQEATGARIDVVFAFLTAHHRDDAESILEQLWLQLDPQTIIGCSAEGVIGGEREIEREPGLALLAGDMSDVRLHPFHIESEPGWRELLSDEGAMKERLGLGEETRALIGFGDSFTTPLTQLLPRLDQVAKGVPLVGGMASGGRMPGENVLMRNDQVYDRGLVGLSVNGPVEVQTVVSQGCRPIGRPLVITKAHDNVIESLGGKASLAVLRDLVSELDERDRDLLQKGLLMGRAISEFKDRFGRGDFLVRNLVGVDEETGAVALADFVRTGQTVQFQVRDAATASEDLSLLLQTQDVSEPAAGGLLFSCNGRGTRLFERPCHDIGVAREAMPATPIAGFFAAGELGPVGGRNFIHGHTASFALFRERK